MRKPSIRPDQPDSNARALAAQAFAAPTTTGRPRTAAGIRRRSDRDGSAAARAAPNKARRGPPAAARLSVVPQLLPLAKLATMSYRALRKHQRPTPGRRAAGHRQDPSRGDIA